MTMPLGRQHLSTIAADLRDGAPLDADHAAQLADALDQIAQGVAPDLALGLRLKPGEHRSQATIAVWNDLLRQTARTFWPSVNAAEQARQLCRSLENYRCGRWQRDRVAVECPYPSHKLESHLWRLLRLRELTIGKRQMHRILKDMCSRF